MFPHCASCSSCAMRAIPVPNPYGTNRLAKAINSAKIQNSCRVVPYNLYDARPYTIVTLIPRRRSSSGRPAYTVHVNFTSCNNRIDRRRQQKTTLRDRVAQKLMLHINRMKVGSRFVVCGTYLYRGRARINAAQRNYGMARSAVS